MKKKSIFLGLLIAASLLLVIGCDQTGDKNGATTPKAVNFVSVEQQGGTSGAADTTALILTFSADPSTLTAGNITLTGATKGTLTGTGTTSDLLCPFPSGSGTGVGIIPKNESL